MMDGSPSMKQTAAHVALSIPEILSLIFSYVSILFQRRFALVCKKWSEVALDELWRCLENLHPLLKLAVPLKSFYNEYGGDKFTNEETVALLRDADWTRFRRYATRVRSITYHQKAVKVAPPSEQGIALICLYHPYGNCLTPNVRTIRWTLSPGAAIAPMIPFLSQSLEELSLKIKLEATETRDLFQSLTHRTPSLKNLSIKSVVTPSEISSSLSLWIQTCLRLEKAHIPRHWQTSPIIAAFGSLPNLFELGIEWDRNLKD